MKNTRLRMATYMLVASVSVVTFAGCGANNAVDEADLIINEYSDSSVNTETEFDTNEMAEGDSTPIELLELKEKNPETADFVDGYTEYMNSYIETEDCEIDISEDLATQEIPLFIQWDERWGYRIYGHDFFAINGCGPTCLAMVACDLLDNEEFNPYDIAMFSLENDYYIYGQGTSWDLMTEGAEKLGLIVEEATVDREYIINNLSPETPMICSVGPGDFTMRGHFIVLRGIDEDGQILVNDPNSKINSEKSWDLDALLPQIKSAWVYKA